ncbi:hypothetical protein K3495_g1776 [Podosphaera aphanis]|nr:hypothetical protein K3495_g1776 [Podosphaera aphanis]
MAPRIITVIGSLNIDLVTICTRIPIGGETLTAKSFFTGPGGKGANQAISCARVSRPNPSSTNYAHDKSDLIVKMIGAVGADEFGPRLISSMLGNGINTSGVRVSEKHATGSALILVEEASGQNRILLNPGANHCLMPEDFRSPTCLGVPLPVMVILQLEIPLPTVIQIVKTAKQAGVDVLLNPAPAVPLPSEVYMGLSHLILNESEAAILTSRSLEELERLDFDWKCVTDEFLGKGVKNVTVTLGARGVFFASTENKHGEYVPAIKVTNVVDTTAAGDTFVGAYAVKIVEGERQMSKVLHCACTAAARTVEKKGTLDAIPWSNEIEL